jgi:hypothetical protein
MGRRGMREGYLFAPGIKGEGLDKARAQGCRSWAFGSKPMPLRVLGRERGEARLAREAPMMSWGV